MDSSEKRIIRIEDKIDILSDKLASIDSTLASQHESLKYHIRRTDLLEAKVEPLESFKDKFAGSLKLISIVAMIAGIIEGFTVLLEYLKK